jgi:pterin-4a-carbinolamine dehydratase
MGLLKLPNWQLTDDGTALRRAFTAKNWAAGAPSHSIALSTALRHTAKR